MGACLHYPAAVQNYDHVGTDDCRQAVGNHQGRPILEECLESFLYQSLCAGVNVSGSLVEDDYSWVRYHCPGEADE